MSDETSCLLHATTVAWEGRAVLILGASGSGKSSLALTLMAHGCMLVADDQTQLTRCDEKLVARCPVTIQGQIEARGFGILQTPFADSADVTCVLDLDTEEERRLPYQKTQKILGIALPLFHKAGIEVLPFALLQYLRGSTLKAT